MKINIPDPKVIMLIGLLSNEGFRARLVGGAVRDIVAGTKPKDMDLATDAQPHSVMEVARNADLKVVATGLQHGTVTVVVDGVPYEVTTLRADVETDGRHAEVRFISDFREDACRRDFTFNAMSAEADGELFDYFGGVQDLKNRRVRFVGGARQRIEEDYLRILRFFRFRARYGGSENVGEFDALRDGRDGLRAISVERVWSEISRILVHPRGLGQLETMSELGISDVIGLPCFPDRMAVASASAAIGASPGTCLGLLSRSPEEAEEIAIRWKLSNKEREQAVTAATVLDDPETSPRYWLGRAVDGLNPGEAALVLTVTGRSEAAEALSGAIPSFPLRGRDLLSICEPGPRLGEIMNAAKEAWKDSGFIMTAEELVEFAERVFASRKAGM